MNNIPGVMPLYNFLFWRFWPKESVMDIQGSKMYLNPDGLPKQFAGIFKHYILSGVWKEVTTEMFVKAVKEGDTVVDVGAHIGYFTLLASRLVGEEGRVYAFEPEPLNFSLLVKNIEINGYKNIIPVQKAVSNTAGTVRLFIDEKSSMTHTISKCSADKDSIEIETVTLDDFFKDKEHPINIVKMNIEGAEMAALLGMDRLIRQNEHLKIFIEFHPDSIKGVGYTAEEFAYKILEEWHFSVMFIDEGTENKRGLRINSVAELIDLSKGEGRLVDLFLEKGKTSLSN